MRAQRAERGAQKLRVLFLLFIFCALPSAIRALDPPPAPAQWVTDAADVLSVTDESILNQKLREFEQSTGAQFIIYILPSLQGDPVEDFTIRAVGKWKVGQKKYDNGLVLFVFIAEKKVRVEVGYGLEGTVTDAFSSRVIREQIAPHFQRGDYAAGLNAGADALMTQIRKGEAPVEPLQPQGAPQGQRQGGEDISIVTLLFILFIVFFVIAPMFSRRRRGRGGCGGCIFPWFFFPGGGGVTFGGGGFGGGGGWGGGGGGFSGGGGSFGGGGASGDW